MTMKLSICLSVAALAAFISAPANADSQMARAGALECESNGFLSILDHTPASCRESAHEASASDTTVLDRETRMAEDEEERQALVDRIESTYGKTAWYESASEADLARATVEASALLAQLNALYEAMGEESLAQNQSLIDGIADRVSHERTCRSDPRCMEERAAKRSDEAFRETVLFRGATDNRVLEVLQSSMPGLKSDRTQKAESGYWPGH